MLPVDKLIHNNIWFITKYEKPDFSLYKFLGYLLINGHLITFGALKWSADNSTRKGIIDPLHAVIRVMAADVLSVFDIKRKKHAAGVASPLLPDQIYVAGYRIYCGTELDNFDSIFGNGIRMCKSLDNYLFDISIINNENHYVFDTDGTCNVADGVYNNYDIVTGRLTFTHAYKNKKMIYPAEIDNNGAAFC